MRDKVDRKSTLIDIVGASNWDYCCFRIEGHEGVFGVFGFHEEYSVLGIYHNGIRILSQPPRFDNSEYYPLASEVIVDEEMYKMVLDVFAEEIWNCPLDEMEH